MYKAIVTELKNIRPHSNADRLKLATVWGNQIIIGLHHKEGELGIYFPSDGQLSEEFATSNDLIRRKDKNGNNVGGMFHENRRVKAQKFRGEISDGFWIPIESLLNVKGVKKRHIENLSHGDMLEKIAGIQLCNKYVTTHTKRNLGVKTRKKRVESVMFHQHFDTPQFGYHFENIPLDARVSITEKLHGTSQRVGHVLVEKSNKLISFWNNTFGLIFGKVGQPKEWMYLNGTRRVVLDPDREKNGFHSDLFRWKAADKFIGNLRKGETVFYEVVGYEEGDKFIMGGADNSKLGKDFVRRFGERTNWTYGCDVGEFKIFVYRITQTNEDGVSMDYSWEDVKHRCYELGVDHVNELIDTMTVEDIVQIQANVEEEVDGRRNLVIPEKYRLFFDFVDMLSQGESEIDPNHIKEGVAVRVEQSAFHPFVTKHKSFEFKVLEGIVKDSGIEDMEESN